MNRLRGAARWREAPTIDKIDGAPNGNEASAIGSDDCRETCIIFQGDAK